MSWYLYLILAYLFILMGFNFYRSFRVKTQDEMMVAGRTLSLHLDWFGNVYRRSRICGQSGLVQSLVTCRGLGGYNNYLFSR